MTPPIADHRHVTRVVDSLATTVTVVSTLGPTGCVAMAWAEPGADDCLITCLRTAGGTLSSITQTGYFVVNVLGAGNERLVRKFAAGGDKFAAVDWTPSETHRLPIIKEAIGSVECDVVNTATAGAHMVVVGRVASATWHSGSPLVHCMGTILPFREGG